ncbi:hypothetical protein AX16_008130 [Volvariella volvacea WC 439]|nr:hypothetical protein AX16_008130 [Volvariella volvacea WC 439]
MPNDFPPPNAPIGFGEMTDEIRWTRPIQAERKLRVICIGAGASGLQFAYKLQRSFTNIDLTVYEKNKGVAGTWFENKYPGCACDIASHAYIYTFEPKPDWSSMYAGTNEIESYFNSFATKYNLRPYIKTQHQIIGAFWVEDKGIWRVDVRNLETGEDFTDECHVLVNAGGVLNAWKWPQIPGLEDFKGVKMHTAKWDHNVDLRGKRVAVIGNGSSAIQVVPAIQPIVSKLTTFIRTPTWISPPLGMEARTYTEEEKQRFATDPAAFTEFRKNLEKGYHGFFPLLIRNSEVQASTKDVMTEQMKNRLDHDEAFEEQLIPKWSVGCRRLTPGPGYLEALRKENVEVVQGEIERITETGCLTGKDGYEHEFDVLICATGFDTSYRPRFPIIGRHGKNLQEEWSQEPKTYMGLAAADFPNYFMLIGPNSPIGNGPVLIAVETLAEYVLKFVNRLQTENIHSFAPKAEAVEDFVEYKDRFMAKTVWADSCRSWYKGNTVDGKVIAVWPGSSLHYIEALSDVRYDHWDIRYTGNRFAFMGNGFSQTETDPTADTAFYVRTVDDSPYISTRKARQVMNKSGTVKAEKPVVEARENSFL